MFLVTNNNNSDSKGYFFFNNFSIYSHHLRIKAKRLTEIATHQRKSCV